MATIEGGSRNDTLVGTLGGDTIRGRGGHDTIYADPAVFDFIGGNDTVDGGDGDDLIYAFGGRDSVRGGTGRDRIFTADGDDVIDAGTGDDSDVQSGRGNDLVHGGAGADDLKGGEGADRLYGEAGADRVAGGSDNDLVVGGEGADTLGGRTGADQLDLGEVTRAADTVVFQAEDVGAGVDTIVGFDPGAPSAGGDLLDLRALAGSVLVTDAGDGTAAVHVGGTLLAQVEGVSAAELLDGNVLFGSSGVSPDALFI
jgi:Ca2+-binding RTX toxin-like protein